MIQLNNWCVCTVLPLHVEADRVIIGFMRKPELEKAILVQRGEYGLVFENLSDSSSKS
jgi:hypothetical protein